MIWSGNHWSVWGMALMGLAMVAFWALVIWAVYAIVSGTSRHHVTHHHRDNPGAILDGRLARGEIDPDEYRRLRDLLATHRDGDSVDSR